MKGLILWISLVCCLVGSCMAEELNLEKQLAQKMTYDFDGVSFSAALQRVSADTKLNIMPLESVNRSWLYKEKIYLNVKNMPLGQLLDWLAGAVQSRYRIYPDGRVYISQNYEWVEVNRFGMLFIDLKDIITGSMELQGFDSGIAELTRIITLFDDNYYIRTEQQADMVKLVAHVPRELKPVFVEVVEAFKREGLPLEGDKPEVNTALAGLAEKLGKVREVNYSYQPLNQIIKRLENDFGVNIGCSGVVYADKGGVPEISLKLGRVSLKEAVDCIIEKTSLAGAELSLPDGIWLTGYKSDWQQGVTRRFLWNDNLQVRAYNINRLNMQIPGLLLAEQIMQKIAVRAWYDPLAGVYYHEKTGNLIILADSDTQERVLIALQELLKRVGG